MARKPKSPTPLALTNREEERVSLLGIQCCFSSYARVSSQDKTNPYYLKADKYWYWDTSVAAGKSYLVGDMPTPQYLKKFSSPLSKWQKIAYIWILKNSDKILIVETRSHYWRIFLRGEFVEFSLPHQDQGGERNYITRTGKTKLLVNED